MQQIIPRIITKDSRAAAEFYKSIFGGEITEMYLAQYGETCTHAALNIKEAAVLYFADEQQGSAAAPGIHMCIALHDMHEAREIFSKLSESGTITEPLEPTDWALLYGCARDKFGVIWEINCGEGADAQFVKA